MFDPRMQVMLAEARRNNLLKEAKKIRASQTASPRFQERALLRIGELLVSTGVKLQERYKPTTYPYPKAC